MKVIVLSSPAVMATALDLCSTDTGNCRIYYKSGRRLFCFQEERVLGKPDLTFKFYVCSYDGEPSHEAMTDKFVFPLPKAIEEGYPGEEMNALERSFKKFLATRGITLPAEVTQK